MIISSCMPAFCSLRQAVISLAALLASDLAAQASPVDIALALGPSTSLPSRSDIEAVGAKVGDHYRTLVPCGAGNCAVNNRWNNAVLMMGVLQHWQTYGTAAYRSYAESWAGHNDWKLFTDTSGGDQQNPSWDNRMAAGYSYLRLLQAGTPGASVADVTRNLDAQLALPLTPEKVGLIDYVFPGSTKSSLSWKIVDANFMGLPTWIAMGRQTGDARYYDRARDLQNYQLNVMGLRDPTTGLYFQRESDKAARTAKGLHVAWGRGNGWMAAGLAEALTDLPTSRAEYATYRSRFTGLMQALRTRQRADGFWSMNIADPDDSPGPESSATALITFAMARGIKLGILDRPTYAPVAAKAWNAMAGTAVANDGRLGFCQPIGKRPIAPGAAGYPSEGSADTDLCVGALLLAGTAMYDIASSTGAHAARAFEAEGLATTLSAGDSEGDVASAFAGGGRASLANLNAVGDFVQYRTGAVADGDYELRIKVRLMPTGAVWQLRRNGTDVGAPVDSYDASAHYAELSFGAQSGGAPATYRLMVRGRNGASTGYRIGVDRISLVSIASGGSAPAAMLPAGLSGAGRPRRAGAGLGPRLRRPPSRHRCHRGRGRATRGIARSGAGSRHARRERVSTTVRVGCGRAAEAAAPGRLKRWRCRMNGQR
ncbi:MAG: glycoside hydrolase family 88 protein [Amaricoccus sp.]